MDEEEDNDNIVQLEPTKRYYVSNKRLYEEMVKWRDSDPDPRKRVISEELGLMVKEIATRLTSHVNFRNYPYDMKQEMISNAMCKVFQGLKNYKFKYENPFGYITRACWNANVNVCIKYYKDKNLPRELVKDNLSQLDEISAMDGNKIKQAIREFLDYEPKSKDEEDEDYPSSPIINPPNPKKKKRAQRQPKIAAAKTQKPEDIEGK